MNISCEEHRSAVVLTLRGECTFDDVDTMRRSIQPYLERHGLAMVVDGCELQRIDSAVIAAPSALVTGLPAVR